MLPAAHDTGRRMWSLCERKRFYMGAEQVDVLIVGAGLSGIAAGYYLQTRCPKKSYAIIEARDAIGGTWDLFRYPGVRSDSDMFTLGYSFGPGQVRNLSQMVPPFSTTSVTLLQLTVLTKRFGLTSGYGVPAGPPQMHSGRLRLSAHRVKKCTT